jgi:hypothetical protein
MTIWVFLSVIVQQDGKAPVLRNQTPDSKPAWTANRTATASNLRCGPSCSAMSIDGF